MANSAVVGLLRILLQAETAEYTSAMRAASKEADQWTRTLRSVGHQATNIGSTLTKALTVPLLAIAGSASKFAIDFESSFAGVRKTVKATEPEFAAMAMAFRQLSKEIPINVNELNRLGEAAGALGIPKGQVVDFARVMAMLGTTTNLTSDQAAESIAKIQNIFNAAGKDTERFASTLVALGKDGASTESQILEMATRIAGAGNALNMSQGQVLAFASALSSVGIEAEMGGSAISRVFIEISAAVSKGGEAVQGFANVATGGDVQKFITLFRDDAATAVNAFITGLGNIKQSGGDLIGTINDLGFSEIRVRDTLLRTAGAGALLTDALRLQDQAWQANSELTNTARERYNTTAGELTKLWNRIKDVGITLGNALLPGIKAGSSALSALLPIVDALAHGFAMLPGALQLVVLGMAGLAAAAGPVLVVFGQVALGAATITSAFGKKGIATRALALDLGILRGAMATLPFAAIAAGAGLMAAAIVNLRERSAELAAQAAAAARALEAQGAAGRQQVTDRLAQMERELAEAVRDGNKARAARLTQDIEAVKNDQARLAIQDTINLAISRGADANVKYAEAVKFNAEWVAKQRTEQAAATTTTTSAANATVTLAQVHAGIAEATRKYNEALQGKRAALSADIEAMDKTGLKVDDLATKHRVSEQVVTRLKAEIESKEKTDRKAIKAEDDATRAAERRRAEIDKQEASFAKLGLVTARYVNNELADLLEMESAAQVNGADMNMVLRAMLPTLTELRTKAAQSGVEVAGLAEAFTRAKAAQDQFDASLKQVPWSQLMADMRAAAGIKKTELIPLTETEAQKTAALTSAYETLGLTSRKELRDQATAAIFAYYQIRQSGTATPKEIEAAFKAMVAAVNAANGEIPGYWTSVVMPQIRDGLNNLIGGFSSAFAGLLTGSRNFWDSFKQSAISTFEQILEAFLNGLIKRMIAGLAGLGGGGGWGSILQGAFGGGGVPGMGGGLPYGGVLRSLLGMGGATGIGVTTGVPASLAGVGATGIGAGGTAVGTGAGAGTTGFLTSGLGTALGGVGVGAAGFGLGYLLSQKFGTTAGAIGGGLGGAATGALIGTAVFPGIGTGVGALIGGLSGLVGGLLGGGDDGDKSRDRFIAAFGGRGTGEGSGFGTLQGQLGKLGDRGNQLFEALIGADSEKKSVAAINKILEAFNSLEFKQIEVTDATKALTAQREQLIAAGLNEESVLQQQSAGYSALYNQILATGTDAPAALQPIFLSLAEMGLLLDKDGQKVTDLGQMFDGAAAVSTLASERMRSAIKAQLDTLDGEMKRLTDSIAGEAPEEVMGVIEAQARERIAAVQREREALIQQLEEASAQASEAAETHAEEGMHAWDPYPDHVREQFNTAFAEAMRIAEETGRDLRDVIRDVFKDPLRIPVVYDYPEGQPAGPPRVKDFEGPDYEGPRMGGFGDVGGAASGILATHPTLAVFGEGGEPELGGPVSFMAKALAGAIKGTTPLTPSLPAGSAFELPMAQQRDLDALITGGVRALELATEGGAPRGDIYVTLDMRGATIDSPERAQQVGDAFAIALAQHPVFQRVLGQEMRYNPHGLGSDVRQTVKG